MGNELQGDVVAATASTRCRAASTSSMRPYESPRVSRESRGSSATASFCAGSQTAQQDAERLWGADASQEMASSAKSDVKTAGWSAMVSSKYRRATLTAFLLFVCQQLSGINAVVYFSTQIFRDAGVTSAVLSSLLVMLVNVAGTAFVAAPLIDRFGRTTMLSASYAGMASSMAVMGGCLASPALAGTSLLTAITLLGTVAYVFAFSCGSGPVPSLLVPELFPAELRGKGGSVAMLSH